MVREEFTIICFDFGMKYIGVAVGQTVTMSGSAVGSLRAKDGIPQWAEMDKLIAHWRPQLILVGDPLNMDDTPQQITHSARKFANRLKERYKIPVELVDERLSTWEVKNLADDDMSMDKLNAEAAAVLLRQWLGEM